MQILMIILRTIHIFSGIFWVGTSLFFVLFFQPTLKASGPAGGKVAGRLALTRFPLIVSLSSIFTVAAGLTMYWLDSNGFQPNWIVSPPGIVLTIGALAGVLAFLVGGIVLMPANNRMAAIQKEIQAAGASATPAPAQLAEMGRLQARIATASRWGAVLMGIAVLGMTMARELGDI